MDLSNINFLAVLVAALVAFVLGAVWYNPAVFGKRWQSELGFTDEYLQQGSMLRIFGTSFVMMFIMSLGMAILLKGHGGNNIDGLSGAYHGLAVGLMFVGGSMAINYLYQRRAFRLWLIDALYQTIFLTLMGLIIGAWQ